MIRKIAIVGASGRMGRELLAAISRFPQFSLGAALVSAGSSAKGQPTGVGALSFEPFAPEHLNGVECVIDFSTPDLSGLVAEECGKRGLALLIGTTGIDELQEKRIASASLQAPIVLAPNTSIGVAALSELAALAQQILGPTFDIELAEIHHREKKDAPSGTAKALAARLAEDGGLQEKFSRPGKRADRELGIVSLRGGGVFGEHTIYFLGNGERIELTHKAESRAIFAQGAFVLMSNLIGRPAGLYRVADLLKGVRNPS